MLYSFFLYLSRRLFPNLANVTFQKNGIFKKSRVNGGKGKWIWESRGGIKKNTPPGSRPSTFSRLSSIWSPIGRAYVSQSIVAVAPVPAACALPCYDCSQPCGCRHGIDNIALAGSPY